VNMGVAAARNTLDALAAHNNQPMETLT